VVVASIEENGLISKHFKRGPQSIMGELRKCTFPKIERWKKVILIGAGTGFAPFRGYLQEKELAMKENRPFPIVTLYFGCRKSNSDFIYKEEILRWKNEKVINSLHTAFSREVSPT
jgi:sulfite reductase alpha subunit-like flavoprotein